MFDPLRNDVVARFLTVESFFKGAHGLKGDSAQVAKGLAFVQMYSAYEYTVCAVFKAAVDTLVSHNHPRKNLTPSLLALFLEPQLQSLRDCKAKDIWDRRLKLFEQIFSDDFAIVGNGVFPNNGVHFRHQQLEMIFKVLGIKRSPVQRQLYLQRIDEVVAHRNAIAHGREAAEKIGRQYSRLDILHRIQQMKSVSLTLISIIQKHCSNSSLHIRK